MRRSTRHDRPRIYSRHRRPLQLPSDAVCGSRSITRAELTRPKTPRRAFFDRPFSQSFRALPNKKHDLKKKFLTCSGALL